MPTLSKRTVHIIGAAIGIGVLVNCGVAFLCTLAAQAGSRTVSTMTRDEAIALSRRHMLFPEEPGLLWGSGRHKGFGYLEFKMGTVAMQTGSPSTDRVRNLTVSEIEAGWPLRSFRRSMLIEEGADGWFMQYQSFGPGGASRRDPTVVSADADSFILPTKPIWFAFAVNSVLYALAIAAAIYVPRRLLRAMRETRGLCPACAYPIGTYHRCTECGEVLPKTAKGRDTWKHDR